MQNFTNPVFADEGANELADNSGAAAAAATTTHDAPPPPLTLHSRLTELSCNIVDASTFLEDSTIIDMDDPSLLAHRQPPAAYIPEPDAALKQALDMHKPISAASPRGAMPEISLDISMLSVGDDDVGSNYVEGPAMDLSLDMSLPPAGSAPAVSEATLADAASANAACHEPFHCSIEGIEGPPSATSAPAHEASGIDRAVLHTLPDDEFELAATAAVDNATDGIHDALVEEESEETIEALVHQEDGADDSQLEIDSVEGSGSNGVTARESKLRAAALSLSCDNGGVDTEQTELPGDDIPAAAEPLVANPHNPHLVQMGDLLGMTPDAPPLPNADSVDSAQPSMPAIGHGDSMDPFSALFGDLNLGGGVCEAPPAPKHTPSPSAATDVMDFACLSMNVTANLSELLTEPESGAAPEEPSASTTPADIMAEWMSEANNPFAATKSDRSPGASNEPAAGAAPQPRSGNPFADSSQPVTPLEQQEVSAGDSGGAGQEALPSGPRQTAADNPFASGNFLGLLG